MLATRSLAHLTGPASFLLRALVTVWIAGETLILLRSLFRSGAHTRDRGSLLAVVVSIFAGFALGNALAASFPGAGPQRGGALAVFYAGVALMATGITLRFYAVAVLGRFFTPVVMVGADQHVVDSGPYRWIRHPSYTGLLMIVAGVLVAGGSFLALLGVLPVLAAVMYRIRVEERALSEELGDAYRSYMDRTKRLLPFVY